MNQSADRPAPPGDDFGSGYATTKGRVTRADLPGRSDLGGRRAGHLTQDDAIERLIARARDALTDE